MKNCFAALMTFVVLLSLVSFAKAQTHGMTKSYSPSSQWFAMELKLGPYKPAVDSGLGGTSNPYADIFGNTPGLMTQLTFDVQLLAIHGSLGLGGTVGFFRATGSALLESGEPSADDTTFTIVPLILQLVYRWEYAAKRWNVPLVPYLRAGLVYSLYWITDGSGNIARWTEGGGKARGGVWGYQLNVGLAFLLDPLDRQSARRLDSEIGVNHTYLFAEFVHSLVDNFGGEGIRLGMNNSLLAGLVLEF